MWPRWTVPLFPGMDLCTLVSARLSYSRQHPTQQQQDTRKPLSLGECRDGENNNLTWNCGAEGPTSDLRVQRLRARQQRNLATALLLSQGVPMILMGDEYGHSKVSCPPPKRLPAPCWEAQGRPQTSPGWLQGGNNNTYCHDTPLNWFNWRQAAADETGFARFFRLLVNLRYAAYSPVLNVAPLMLPHADVCSRKVACTDHCHELAVGMQETEG